MGLDDGAADRQAEPGVFALVFAARRIGTIEPVEQARQALGRNRRTLVLHAQASVAETDTYLAAIGGEAQGVVQQVGQHPPQHAAVAGQAQAASRSRRMSRSSASGW